MSDFSKKQAWNIVTSVLFAVALFLFILTFSIGLPIYCRPFYYAHIDALNLPEKSGFTAEQIRQSYDAVLDYLTLPNREFSVGDMAYSPDGAAHFADCKALFDLNIGVLICSAICLIVLLVLRKVGKIQDFCIGRHPASFYSAMTTIFLPVTVGILASLNFDRAFVIFHSIFFPGKENWIFDPYTDEIIRVLPRQFFMNAAILIGASVLILSLIILIFDRIKDSKK